MAYWAPTGRRACAILRGACGRSVVVSGGSALCVRAPSVKVRRRIFFSDGDPPRIASWVRSRVSPPTVDSGRAHWMPLGAKPCIAASHGARTRGVAPSAKRRARCNRAKQPERLPVTVRPRSTPPLRVSLVSRSGRADSNCRPHGPEPCALPNCATPREGAGRCSQALELSSESCHLTDRAGIGSPGCHRPESELPGRWQAATPYRRGVGQARRCCWSSVTSAGTAWNRSATRP